MGVGHEEGFEGGRGEVDVLVKHGEEPGFEPGSVGFAGVVVVEDVFFGEEDAEHGAGVVADEGDSCFVCGLFPAGKEVFCFLFKNLIEVRNGHHLFQCLNAGGNGQGVAGEGACLVDGAVGGDAVHDFFSAAVGCCGEAAADDFAEACHVGVDVVAGLGSVEGGAEAAHNFVKYEDGAVFFGFFPECFEEAFHRRYTAHVACHRFYDDGGDFITLLVHHLGEGGNVVVGNHQGVFGGAFGDAGAVGAAEGGGAGACFDEEAVAVAVVAAFKFQNLVSSGVSSGGAEGAHGGFGTGVDHAHFFNGRVYLVDEFGNFRFQKGGCAVAGASFSGCLDGFDDGGMGVAQDHGAPGAYVVDVGIAVDVGDVGAVGFPDEGRRTAHVGIGADRAVDAAGHVFPGFFKGGFGLGEVDHLPASSFSHLATSGAW